MSATSYRKLTELSAEEIRLIALYGRCEKCGAPKRGYRTETEHEIHVSVACADHSEHGPGVIRPPN